MLDQAFEALNKFDWGQDIKVLAPIDEAVISTHGDVAKRKELEDRLAATLKGEMPLDAKQFVCRKLMVIGTAASVPALAALLPDKQLSHMARFALERITAPEAAAALRDALPKLSGAQKAGVISSLGTRKDAASVPRLAELLGDGDATIARAAAYALGVIRTPEAGSEAGGG
jgi:HEAT repeat protein